MNNTQPYHNTNGNNSPFGQNDSQSQLDTYLGYNNINPTALDFSHLQNSAIQQQQQRLNDARTPNLQQQQQQQQQQQGFPHAPYNVNSVVPAKRPRGGEDNVGGSPRPSHGPQGGSSGSLTPQQSGFQTAFQATPYQHLQQQRQASSSNHATPSPVPPSQPQVLHSIQPPTSNSPHQFNENFGNFPQQAQSRSNAPQTPNNPAFMHSITSQNAAGMAGVQNGPAGDTQRQQYQLKMQQIQMQQQAQQQAQQQLQGNNMLQNRQIVQGMGPSGNPGMNMSNMSNGPSPVGRTMQSQTQGQQPAQGQAKQGPSGETSFMKSLFGFLSKHNLTLEREPKVCGRQINYFHLFQEASKKAVIVANANPANWPLVATALGFPPNQYPTAAEEIKAIFQRNLMAFSQTWAQMMQKRKMQIIQQQQQQQKQQQLLQQQQHQQVPSGQTTDQTQLPQQQSQTGNVSGQQQPQTASQQQPHMGGVGGQQQSHMSPQQTSPPFIQGPLGNDSHQLQATPQHPSQLQPPVGVQTEAAVQAQSSPPHANGLFTSQGPNLPTDQTNINNHQRSISIAQPTMLTTGVPQPPLQTPPRTSQFDGNENPIEALATHTKNPADVTSPDMRLDRKTNELHPNMRFLTYPSVGSDKDDRGGLNELYYGGLPTENLKELGEKLAELKPGVPTFEEMGVVDIHALTMSIQSGIRGEVRYALDQLVGLSSDVRVTVPLIDCEILVESLVECGEDLLEILARAAKPTTGPMDLPLVEELAKEIARDDMDVQKVPPFGTEEFELRRAADWLIAISTVLRNFSCPDNLPNHEILAGTHCINFIASIIRTMATRHNVLRNARNTQDIMKDIVTMLSQVSHRLHIPDEDDALSLLQLLVSFAPSPIPKLDPSSRSLTFTPYDPKVHQYLPSAVDALAKLLARDDPNRTYFKAIFASEPVTSSPHSPHNLLTRAFALAIAPIPDRHAPHIDTLRGDLLRIAHARNPFFSQGMLAADILASLAPGPSDPLATLWLESEDCWAQSLLHLLMQLSHEPNQGTGARQPTTGRVSDWEMRSVNIVTTRGLSMLKRLAEKVDRVGLEASGRVGVAVNGSAARTGGDVPRAKDALLAGVLPDRDAVLRAVTDAGFETQALKQLLAFAALDG